MEIENSFANNDNEQLQEYAYQLINFTLAPLSSTIKEVLVKVDQNMALSFASFDFHCTILLKAEDGSTLYAEARDGDDILSVYRALTKIIDQLPIVNLKVDYDNSKRIGISTEC